jgi:hypothetical protein
LWRWSGVELTGDSPGDLPAVRRRHLKVLAPVAAAALAEEIAAMRAALARQLSGIDSVELVNCPTRHRRRARR